jgi:uncharacterized protein (TIGR02284 family)
MQHQSIPEQVSATADSVVQRAGAIAHRAGAATRRVTHRGGSPLMPLVVGTAVGLAAFAFFSRGAARNRGSREGSEETVQTLNHLTAISHDGAAGFRSAAEAIPDPHIKEILERAARRCEQGAAELQRRVKKFGGRPERVGTVSGAAHRGWVNLKAAITGRDKAAILTECERGEDVAKTAYADALEGPLPPDIRVVLQRQYNGVRQNHDRVRNLRDEARAQAG